MTLFTRHKYRQYLFGLLLTATCFFQHCNTQLAGGTSTTDNPKIVGTIIGDDHQVAPNTQVILLPENFNPLHDNTDIVIDTTDNHGRYELPVSHHGVFNIQAMHLVKKTRLLIQGITIPAGEDSIKIADAALNTTGFIKVELPDSINRTYGYLYIPGTTIIKSLAGTGTHVLLDSVPAANLPSVCYETKDISEPTVLRYNIEVLSGDTTIESMPFWKYSHRISFNTTSSGAAINGNVLNFPVLIRLSSSNFHFGEAQQHGEDIRFTKSDNRALPYEIERWNGTVQQAEIWVKIDTVHGNDSTQSIIMYWGNPNISASTNSMPVFDSSDGFKGVWHLSETSGSVAVDASNNSFSGTYNGGLPQNESCPSGICQKVTKPDSDYVDMGDVLNPGIKNISMGIWVKRASLGTQQALISKTIGNGPSATYGFLFSIDLLNFPHFYLISGGSQWGDNGAFDVSGNLTVTDSSEWHYLFVSIDRSDNNNCKLYVDGIERTGTIRGDISSVTDVVNTCHLRVGTEYDNNYSFRGSLAEPNIAFVTRSADWVKLSFMNQKDKDALLKW